ncbi:hypothetical protein SUGI_0023840 [Cryptomeria japonica]|nr:hypothetical protein SUGI_0023840 [Cryptomeria japonica]
MAKSTYAFLAFLLLMAPFTFASVSIDYYDYGDMCRRWSSTFSGLCFNDYHCRIACHNEHSVTGVCSESPKGLACFCYDNC